MAGNGVIRPGTGGLDRETKTKIKSLVLGLRRGFEQDFAKQLLRLGIEKDVKPNGAPSYLSGEERAQRQRILAVIRREQASEGTRAQAIDAYVRDAAFTYTNRLIGLRCMEARQLLFVDGEATEVVTLRGAGVFGGRSQILAGMREANRAYRDPDWGEERLWREGLKCAFLAVTEDIRVLFDPEHEFSVLFPTHAVLMSAVNAINTDLPAEVYGAPDLLGWVYQFFNAEEKVEVRRRTKGKPGTSHELAVMNQFYTPDWIVKFLVDNTLGRLWLQMRPETRLYWRNRVGDRDPEIMAPEERAEVMFQGVNIDYLVPGTGEGEPVPVKPAAELTLLDPACGTMHFGQYAFALLYEMHLEEGVTPPEEIPSAILTRNLHGIDIDPRAIQIAALSLLLTAKEQARAHHLDPRDLRVRGMNLVCADSVNLGTEECDKLLTKLDPGVFGGPEPLSRAVEALWRNLEHVGELGSLLRVDEDVLDVLRRPVGLRMRVVSPEQGLLLPTEELDMLLPGLDEEEAATARDALLEELLRIAAQRSDGDELAQLFAAETAKGVRLVEALTRKYDVVVMNPPYGSGVATASQRAASATGELAVDFARACLRWLSASGYMGAISTRTWQVLSTQHAFRTEVVLGGLPLVTVLDLGFGVLDDADVDVCAFCCKRAEGDTGLSACFVDAVPVLAKPQRLVLFLTSATSPHAFVHRWRLADFRALPNAPIAYRMPLSLAKIWIERPGLDPDLASMHAGLQSSDAPRVQRFWWEVYRQDIGHDRRWSWLANVAEPGRFYRPIDEVILWEGNGATIRSFDGLGGRPKSYLRNDDRYFEEGLTFPITGALAFAWTAQQSRRRSWRTCGEARTRACKT